MSEESHIDAIWNGDIAPDAPRKPLILFTGAGGTGKTTLMKVLAEKLDLPIVGSVVRETVKKFGVHTEDQQRNLSPEKAWEMQLAIHDAMEDSLVTAAKAGPYITDRSMLDPLAYALWKDVEFVGDSLPMMEMKAFAHLKAADLVIYCPVGVFDPPPDGHRTTNEAERVLTDTIIAGYLRKFGAHVTVLNMTAAKPEVRLNHTLHGLLKLGFTLPEGALPSEGPIPDFVNDTPVPERYAYAAPS